MEDAQKDLIKEYGVWKMNFYAVPKINALMTGAFCMRGSWKFYFKKEFLN